MFDPWSDELISELHFYAPPPSCSSSAPPFWEGGGEQRPTDLRKRKGIKVTITTANHTKVGLKRQKGGRDPEIADSRVAEQRHKKIGTVIRAAAAADHHRKHPRKRVVVHACPKKMGALGGRGSGAEGIPEAEEGGSNSVQTFLGMGDADDDDDCPQQLEDHRVLGMEGFLGRDGWTNGRRAGSRLTSICPNISVAYEGGRVGFVLGREQNVMRTRFTKFPFSGKKNPLQNMVSQSPQFLLSSAYTSKLHLEQ